MEARQKAVRGWVTGTIAAGVAVACLFGVDVILALLIGGLVGMIWLLFLKANDGIPGSKATSSKTAKAIFFGWLASRGAKKAQAATLLATASTATSASTVSLMKLAWFFLKVGSILYGSGYVLIAYLQGGLVDDYGWLTESELVDAVAIGQLTPGPILSTASFIGYVVMNQQGGWTMGVAGAIVASLAIFLPSFLLVAATGPIVPKLRKGRKTSAFLDAINAASMGIMGAVTLKLAGKLYFPEADWRSPAWTSLAISAVAAVLIFRFKLNPIWIVLLGGVAGAILL